MIGAEKKKLLAELTAEWELHCGRGWRLKAGEILFKIRDLCEYGEWGEFLARYDIARSTADDWVRRYQEESPETFTENRQIVKGLEPEPQTDDEAAARAAKIAEELAKRKNKPRVHHPTQVGFTIKDLRPDQTARYWAAKNDAPEEVAKIWRDTFFEIIGSVEVIGPDDATPTTEAAPTNDTPTIEAVKVAQVEV